MADRGGQPGNQNAANGKLWRAAILRALEKRGAGDRVQALDDMAEKLLSKCDSEDISALKELGDRVDGKPTTTIAGDPENPLQTLNEIKVKLVGSDSGDT